MVVAYKKDDGKKTEPRKGIQQNIGVVRPLMEQISVVAPNENQTDQGKSVES